MSRRSDIWAWQARRTGWAGALGLVLACAAAGFWWNGNRPLARHVDALQAEAAALRKPATGPKATDPRVELTNFYAMLPLPRETTAVLLRIDAYAAQHGLQLERADQREGQAAGSRITKLEFLLPVRGSYESVRGWLADLADNMPELALEDFRVKRPDIGRAEVEAQVRLALYLRRVE
ncbi:MAG: hypothetical protein KF778_02720 [Rhodocyclaceae bacterium]|nr:hypothetical protein [Rhodocyclaceae bacterium]MBX3667290.1 hypothetical protein [Rhodocyclaceae bacterium]